MRRSRITITLQQKLVEELDQLIDGEQIRNRSHAIEFILNEYFKPDVKKAVILAKALIPIKGKPLLEYLIENIKQSGISEIIICIGYLGEKIKSYFKDGQKFGVKISYFQEKKPLQTGGAISKIKSKLKDKPFLVVYGDILTNLPMSDLISFHEEYKPIATIALTTSEKPESFGQLKLHGIKLVNFYQKTKKPEFKSNLIHCGLYVFQPEIFNFFPKNKDFFLLEDVIEELIKKKKVNGFVFEEQWFDVGNPKNYERAIKEFLPPIQKSSPLP